jgi:hypothetical protein
MALDRLPNGSRVRREQEGREVRVVGIERKEPPPPSRLVDDEAASAVPLESVSSRAAT